MSTLCPIPFPLFFSTGGGLRRRRLNFPPLCGKRMGAYFCGSRRSVATTWGEKRMVDGNALWAVLERRVVHASHTNRRGEDPDSLSAAAAACCYLQSPQVAFLLASKGCGCVFFVVVSGNVRHFAAKEKEGALPQTSKWRRAEGEKQHSSIHIYLFLFRAQGFCTRTLPCSQPFPHSPPEHHCCCVRSSTYMHTYRRCTIRARASWKHGWGKRVREGGPLFAISS